MTVKKLLHVLMGLPESSVVMFVKDGELLDIDVVGVTRTQELPDPHKFHNIREAIILTDMKTLPDVEDQVKVKKVYRTIGGLNDWW